MTTTHIVKFYESELGWGGEIWYKRYHTREEALEAVKKSNKDLPDETPDYYIIASYEGVDEVNNPKYDKVYKH